MFGSIRIDRASPLPPRRQLAAQIRALIAAGRLPAGERLPSVRALAARLKLNYNTVAASYRGLAESGHLELRRGAGTRVAGGDRRAEGASRPVTLASQLAVAVRRRGLDPRDIGRLLLEGEWSAAPIPRVALVSTRKHPNELQDSFISVTGAGHGLELHAFDLAAFDPQREWDLIITDPETLRLAQRGAAQPAGRAVPALAERPEYRRHYLELAAGAD